MTGKEIFKIWAPSNSKWTNWVRPVPFTAINDKLELYKTNNFTIPDIKYIKELTCSAIIVDLPGLESIKEGIALSKMGFRPIPIYNGTIQQQGARSTIDNKIIVDGLIYGAYELEKIMIKDNALPAFLLDSNRLNRLKVDVSIFDNSWDIYDQDMPSAEYFLKNGINKIIVRGNKIQKDMKKILYKFQKQGIEIYFTDGYKEPKKINIKKFSFKDKE